MSTLAALRHGRNEEAFCWIGWVFQYLSDNDVNRRDKMFAASLANQLARIVPKVSAEERFYGELMLFLYAENNDSALAVGKSARQFGQLFGRRHVQFIVQMKPFLMLLGKKCGHIMKR